MTQTAPPIGFAPAEIRTDEPTRSARLKWVIIVDEELPPGRAVNAASCVAAATAREVVGLQGPEVTDASGSRHPGLPWAGCSVLAATAEQLVAIRAKAIGSDLVFVADMPLQAQSTRVYDEYLDQLSRATEADLGYHAVSIVGPRNRVDKLTKPLGLLA